MSENTIEMRAERAVAQGGAVAAAVRTYHLGCARSGLPEICLRRLEEGRVFETVDDGVLASLRNALGRAAEQHVIGYRYPWDDCDDAVEHDPRGVEPTPVYDVEGEDLCRLRDLVDGFIKMRDGVRHAVIGMREVQRLIERG
ncbi:hypothetical protein [Cereibacter sphaeroides]|jgi:hypothetical protein|uniref:hypothetical protein n=1 Tax=Cereibacter sphaeroides TaxID=1063 RepID=UPI0000F2A320|nr:hypothetical protein Rsph17029_3211 [Cereibacter sphaeroides ATCC 17029]